MPVSLRTPLLLCAAILLPRSHAHAASRTGPTDQPVSDPIASAWQSYDAPPTLQPAAFRPALSPTSAAPAAEEDLQTGIASWYGRAWKGRRTASGRRFNPAEMTAASHTLPLGTRVLVTLEGSARSVLVTITDHQGTARRIIDLSLAAARELGMVGLGTARVTLRRV